MLLILPDLSIRNLTNVRDSSYISEGAFKYLDFVWLTCNKAVLLRSKSY